MIVSASHGLLELVSELLDLIVKINLDFFSFFLLENNLILVVIFSLNKSLLGLILDISNSLLESDFLAFIESLQICKLLLRVGVNLIDSVLELLLLVFKKLLEFSDSIV